MKKLNALVCVLINHKIVIGWNMFYKYGFNVVAKRYEIDAMESLPIPK